MGNDCCRTRDKSEPFFGNSQPWDSRSLTPSISSSDKRQPVVEAFLRQLALTSPAVRHPAIFRYDLVEVIRFLRVCLYEVEKAYVALLSDLVSVIQRWRIKKPTSISELMTILRTKHLFFFETDFEEVPVLVVKHAGLVSAESCYVLVRHYFDSVLVKSEHAKDSVTVLMDCAGGALPESLVLGLFGFFHCHYPERLHRVLVIRADLDSLTPETRTRLRPHRRRVRICTAEYQSTLLRFIPPERLLFEYGGMRKFQPDGVGLGRLPTRSEQYAPASLLRA